MEKMMNRVGVADTTETRQTYDWLTTETLSKDFNAYRLSAIKKGSFSGQDKQCGWRRTAVGETSVVKAE